MKIPRDNSQFSSGDFVTDFCHRQATVFAEVRIREKNLQSGDSPELAQGRFHFQHGMRTLLTRGKKCNYITVVTWRDDLRWTWHDEKNRTNKRDHGLSFETAQLV